MSSVSQTAFWVIDNDPDTRTILQILLQKVLNCNQVAFFADSADLEMQTAALTFNPDMILVDLVVWPVDGYAILQKLRQNSTFQTVKFVAVTAKVMPPDIKKMREAGFDGLISKPIIRQVFPELIHRILAGESVWYIA
ncbi:MAG: response regulator [Candidatus Promineifilaceae bacterium]|nr:response regulator [Anaerolineaceae bacterium]